MNWFNKLTENKKPEDNCRIAKITNGLGEIKYKAQVYDAPNYGSTDPDLEKEWCTLTGIRGNGKLTLYGWYPGNTSTYTLAECEDLISQWKNKKLEQQITIDYLPCEGNSRKVN